MAPIIRKQQLIKCLGKHGFIEIEALVDLEGMPTQQYKKAGAVPVIAIYNPASGLLSLYDHMPSTITAFLRGFCPKNTRHIDFMLKLLL